MYNNVNSTYVTDEFKITMFNLGIIHSICRGITAIIMQHEWSQLVQETKMYRLHDDYGKISILYVKIINI